MTIAQHPNLSILTAVISFVLFNVVPTPLDTLMLIVFIISMSVWSYGELFNGTNWFRRAVGGIGFAVVAVAVVALIT